MRVVTFAACVFLTASTFLPLRAAVDQDFHSATVLLERAENLEKSGAFKYALQTYDDCYRQLQRIRTDNPNWKSDAVGREMAECFAKIDLLGPQAGRPLPAVAPVQQVDVSATAPTSTEFPDRRCPRVYPWKPNIVTTLFWIGEDKHPSSS